MDKVYKYDIVDDCGYDPFKSDHLDDPLKTHIKSPIEPLYKIQDKKWIDSDGQYWTANGGKFRKASRKINVAIVEDLPKEEWKEIKEIVNEHRFYYIKFYISNKGRCKSVVYYREFPLKREKLQQYTPTRLTRYPSIRPTHEQTFKIHRLVAQYFLDDFNEKLDVHHKDGNRFNNDVNNLEMIKRKEHISHHQKTLPPSKSKIQAEERALKKEKKMREIAEMGIMRLQGRSYIDIGRNFNMSGDNVRILLYTHYKEIVIQTAKKKEKTLA